jgi:hypothetical protein
MASCRAISPSIRSARRSKAQKQRQFRDLMRAYSYLPRGRFEELEPRMLLHGGHDDDHRTYIDGDQRSARQVIFLSVGR